MKYNLEFVSTRNRKEIEKENHSFYFSNKKLSTSIYHDAVVLPVKQMLGGAVESDNKYILGSCLHYGVGGAYPHNNDVISEGTAIYMGWFHNCWGHSITDSLKKMWFIHTNQCKELLSKGAKLVYITSNGKKDTADIGPLLEMANIDLSMFTFVETPTRYKTLYVPDSSFWGISEVKYERFYTKEFTDIISTIKSNVLPPVPGYEKIYFSTNNDSSDLIYRNDFRRDYGESEISEVFKKQGYKIIYPKSITVKEEISYIVNCKVFASTLGSISHNSIFCNPGTNVILCRRGDFVNYYQLTINEIADLNVTYIDTHASYNILFPEHPWGGPFYLKKTKYLIKYFQQKSIVVPYWFDINWWKYMFIPKPGNGRKHKLIELFNFLKNNILYGVTPSCYI